MHTFNASARIRHFEIEMRSSACRIPLTRFTNRFVLDAQEKIFRWHQHPSARYKVWLHDRALHNQVGGIYSEETLLRTTAHMPNWSIKIQIQQSKKAAWLLTRSHLQVRG